MAKGGYDIRDMYQGGYSSFNPSYGSVFSGYHVSARNFGFSTDPRTANILQDAAAKLASGAKQIEISQVSPDVFESIPQQHLKEMNRFAKLTGVDVSMHAPVVEPSGIGREGFSEANRMGAERQMYLAVERSHELNPNGNIPVTFHSSAGIPQPVTPKGKEAEEIFVIDEENGSIGRMPVKKRTFPGAEGKQNAAEELKKINQQNWGERIRNIAYYANIGEREIKDYSLLSQGAEAERKAGRNVTDAEKEAENLYKRGAFLLRDSYRMLEDAYEIANKYGSDSDKKMLNEFARKIAPKAEKLKELNRPEDIHQNTVLRKEILDEGINILSKIGEMPPELYKPLDDFAKEKTVQTFANVAFNSFKKFGDNAPIISIENPPVGGAFSRGSELKDVVEKTREKFIENAMKEGMDKEKAKKQAEKLIGVTWDVGHINMLKKYGFENKDIVAETAQVVPLIKHIHLSDNFGIEHTELPMGMGNVPIKEIMEKIGKKGEEVKKVIEVGNWWQHFKSTPFEETLGAFGSSIYGTGAPYWNQALGYEQGYFGGLAGQWLPQINYETFGGGFSMLPSELGGQRGGGQGGRMSGRGME